MRRGDQQRAITLLRADAGLQSLHVIEAPLLDLEVQGVPALKYFGDQVWTQGTSCPHEQRMPLEGGIAQEEDDSSR
jgi:hypothetical protein